MFLFNHFDAQSRQVLSGGGVSKLQGWVAYWCRPLMDMGRDDVVSCDGFKINVCSG